MIKSCRKSNIIHLLEIDIKERETINKILRQEFEDEVEEAERNYELKIANL